MAVAAAKTFRINAIAARLPITVKKEKSKQKRLLRFLETPLPLDALMEAWCLFACQWVWKRRQHYFYVLIDETDLPNGWKAIVASIPFRNRAIPIFWLVYEDKEIRNTTYKNHNTLIACLTYGLIFLCYEKTIQPVAEHRNTRRKLHAVITLIKTSLAVALTLFLTDD